MSNLQLEALLNSLSRKFYAKIERIAKECQTEPDRVLDEGAELFRRRYRLLQGPLAQKLMALDEYSWLQSEAARLGSEQVSVAKKKERARKGGVARAKNLKTLPQ